MKGDLPQRRQTYSDAVRYMVYVLWLYGASQRMTGEMVGLRKKQVAGIVDRSEYANRSAMTIEQRQRALDELRLIREGEDGRLIDGNRLPLKVFTIKGG